ncbi:MAG: MATE family efflux transporter [Leptospiraceae bacterium]|nr:MATE family efflux transporter [Leptospiraceae bacterium]MCP5494079.1 MATE family efflux transporter [Leptospiraceae bacterium]
MYKSSNDAKNLQGSVIELIPIALPIFFSQAIDVAMVFVDRYFLAQLGKEELAATLSGGLLTYLITTLMFGILGQIISLVGQYIGAKQPKEAIKTVHQGLLLTVLVTPCIFLLSYFFSPKLFLLFGHENDLYQNELKYFHILSLTVITTPLRLVFANFFIGIGKTSIVTIASLLGVLLNIPISYILVFGKHGFPKLGIEGAATGTILSSVLPIIILTIQFYSKRYRTDYNTATKFRFQCAILTKLIRYGLPSGIEMLVNLSGFLFFTMTMYSYSSDVAASTTIVLNWDMVCFIPLLGISQAVSGQVGKYLGERNKDLALKSSWSALKIGWIYSFFITIVYFTFTNSLVNLFISGEEFSSYKKVVYYGTIMLKISCAYFIFDSTYSILGGILKGSGDTIWTMIMSSSIMWTFAILIFFLKNQFSISPILSWIVLTCMVLTLGIVYMVRFLRKKWLLRLMIKD